MWDTPLQLTTPETDSGLTGEPGPTDYVWNVKLACRKDTLHCGTREIQHETCDGVLLAKAETVELFATEAVPQALLRVGHVLAQVARGVQEGRWDWGGIPCVLFPPPSLPPLGGGVGGHVF